jgi:hypothetical protein
MKPGNIDHPPIARWREELLQLVCLLERLSPSDLERFVLQRKALAAEFRRLIKRAAI